MDGPEFDPRTDEAIEVLKRAIADAQSLHDADEHPACLPDYPQTNYEAGPAWGGHGDTSLRVGFDP